MTDQSIQQEAICYQWFKQPLILSVTDWRGHRQTLCASNPQPLGYESDTLTTGPLHPKEWIALNDLYSIKCGRGSPTCAPLRQIDRCTLHNYKPSSMQCHDSLIVLKLIWLIVCPLIYHKLLGLPTVPYFPGHPVFRPMCPASRLMPSRDAKCPVFSYARETNLRCW